MENFSNQWNFRVEFPCKFRRSAPQFHKIYTRMTRIFHQNFITFPFEIIEVNILLNNIVNFQIRFFNELTLNSRGIFLEFCGKSVEFRWKIHGIPIEFWGIPVGNLGNFLHNRWSFSRKFLKFRWYYLKNNINYNNNAP